MQAMKGLKKGIESLYFRYEQMIIILWEEGGMAMADDQGKWVCAHCGYTANGRFEGDICPQCGLTYWKCSNCGFTFTAAKPPEVCPECGEKCVFNNVTCYTPECGGPGHIDPRL